MSALRMSTSRCARSGSPPRVAGRCTSAALAIWFRSRSYCTATRSANLGHLSCLILDGSALIPVHARRPTSPAAWRRCLPPQVERSASGRTGSPMTSIRLSQYAGHDREDGDHGTRVALMSSPISRIRRRSATPSSEISNATNAAWSSAWSRFCHRVWNVSRCQWVSDAGSPPA